MEGLIFGNLRSFNLHLAQVYSPLAGRHFTKICS